MSNIVKLSDFINDTYLAYRGKLTNVPQPGDEKYNRILTIANRKQREWANDSNVDWPSRYEQRAAGTLALAVQTYDVDDDIMELSDYVVLTDSAGNPTYITAIKPAAISRYTSGAYLYGFNPQQLTFIQTIDASLAGQTLALPCFTMPNDMVNPNDVVSVDDPNWLVYATAAELARNDFAKVQQYPALSAAANTLYANMVAAAQNSSFLQPNGVANNMPQNNVLFDLSSNYSGSNGNQQ